MKRISIVIPTYNEELNIKNAYERIKNIFLTQLSSYAYEILFIDNFSTDSSRKIIEELCGLDENVCTIFNAKNFGFTRSTYYGLTQATGDCTVLLFADLQDPPELLTDFVREWENGYNVVIGIKTKSKESKIKYFMRSTYYKFLKKIAEIDHIEHFTGFGLYDRSFIKTLRSLDDPMPYLRGIIAELGPARKEITYVQEKRELGKSNFNLYKLYELAMLGITSYSKVIMRLATICGFITSIFSLIIAVVTFVIKLFAWDSFPMGVAAISVGLFFFGSVLLFFIGFQGEYILSINTRVMNRPLVIEEKRINLKKDENL